MYEEINNIMGLFNFKNEYYEDIIHEQNNNFEFRSNQSKFLIRCDYLLINDYKE